MGGSIKRGKRVTKRMLSVGRRWPEVAKGFGGKWFEYDRTSAGSRTTYIFVQEGRPSSLATSSSSGRTPAGVGDTLNVRKRTRRTRLLGLARYNVTDQGIRQAQPINTEVGW